MNQGLKPEWRGRDLGEIYLQASEAVSLMGWAVVHGVLAILLNVAAFIFVMLDNLGLGVFLMAAGGLNLFIGLYYRRKADKVSPFL